MNKKALMILLVGSIVTNLAGCSSEISGSGNLANSYENQSKKEEVVLKEGRLESKIESVVKTAEEEANYVYENVFFNSNLDESEKYIIGVASGKCGIRTLSKIKSVIPMVIAI